MKAFKPDEAMLMDYMYGELSQEEKEKVEAYLLRHPEVAEELNAFGHIRDLMDEVEDKEVIAPKPFKTSQGLFGHKWSPFAWPAGIAAAIVLLVVIGRLFSFQIEVSDKTVRLGFGMEGDNRLNHQQVEQMIAQAIAQQNTAAADHQQGQSVADSGYLEEIEKLLNKQQAQNSRYVQDYMDKLAQQQETMILAYLDKHATDNKQFVQLMLTDFAQFMQEQREEDLVYLQARINLMEEDKQLFKLETAQMLNSLVMNNE